MLQPVTAGESGSAGCIESCPCCPAQDLRQAQAQDGTRTNPWEMPPVLQLLSPHYISGPAAVQGALELCSVLARVCPKLPGLMAASVRGGAPWGDADLGSFTLFIALAINALTFDLVQGREELLPAASAAECLPAARGMLASVVKLSRWIAAQPAASLPPHARDSPMLVLSQAAAAAAAVLARCPAALALRETNLTAFMRVG